MRSRFVLSIVSSMFLLTGCQSGGGTAMAEPPVKQSGSLGSGGYSPVANTWIAVGTTEWIVAPVTLPDAAGTYYVSKIASGGTYRATLPSDDGFEPVGMGPWINFATFNRKTGKSTLALDRRAIVWQVTRSAIEADSLLLLMSDTDTNRDGKLNDLDATAVYQLQLVEGKLTRLTPEKTTVVSASPDPIVGGKDRSYGGLFGDGAGGVGDPPPPPVNGLLVTVRTDTNNDGKFDDNEPTQVVRIDPSLKTKPQSVMDASQWQKAIDIWNNG